MKRVVCVAHANSALRASLVQEPAWSGPVWLGSCPISPRFSSLKIAPVGTLPSANKWATQTTHSIELTRLKAGNYV